MIKLEPKNVSYFLKEKIKFVRTLKIKATKKQKQKTIDLLLGTNNSLFKSVRDPSLLVIQDFISTERKRSMKYTKLTEEELIPQTNKNRTRPQISKIPT